jgi:competence CoiA-like predicted nuclease
MKYAISENHRIEVSDALGNPNQKYYCPFCKNEVIVDTENGNTRFIHQN